MNRSCCDTDYKIIVCQAANVIKIDCYKIKLKAYFWHHRQDGVIASFLCQKWSCVDISLVSPEQSWTAYAEGLRG
jgi:hypothetical protein